MDAVLQSKMLYKNEKPIFFSNKRPAFSGLVAPSIVMKITISAGNGFLYISC